MLPGELVGMHKIAYVDTMVFLHYPPLWDLDWLDLLGATSVELVISHNTFYELDHHKDRHPHNSVKRRVRKLLTLIEDRTDPDGRAEVGTGVILRVELSAPITPRPEWGLSFDERDDRTLAAAMEQRERAPAVDIVIVSGDTPMRMKARKLGLGVAAPPADKRYPDPADENEKLQAEIAELKRREPALEVSFTDGGVVSDLPRRFTLSTDDFVEQELAKCDLSWIPMKGPFAPHSGIGAVLGINRQQAEVYNREVDQYVERLREHFARIYSLRRERENALPVRFRVLNTGSKPATQVRVELTAAPFTRFCEINDFPDEPEPPDPPTYPRPGFMGGFPFETLGYVTPPVSRDLLLADALRYSAREHRGPRFEIGKHATTAIVEVATLVQHVPFDCERFFLQFTQDERPPGLHVGIRVTAAELPQPLERNLHFKSS